MPPGTLRFAQFTAKDACPQHYFPTISVCLRAFNVPNGVR